MLSLESLLPAAQKFLERDSTISIHSDPLNDLVLQLPHLNRPTSFDSFTKQPPIFYLLVDGLNFCFWHTDGRKKFNYKDIGGSIALAKLIQLAMRNHPELFTPEALIENPAKTYTTIIEPGGGELMLKNERIKILREIGEFTKKYDFNRIIYAFKDEDVNGIGEFLLKYLPYTFKDEVVAHKIKLGFYKKLRLLISDLMEFGGIPFTHEDNLLVFADYRIPNLFLNSGVLRIEKNDVAKKIKQKVAIAHNSTPEVALRATSIVAAKTLKELLHMSYPELDLKLWLASKELHFELEYPHHRTLSRFY